MALMGYFPLAQWVCSRHLLMQNIWVEEATLVFFIFGSTVSLLFSLCSTFFVYPSPLCFSNDQTPTSLPKVICQGDSDSFSFWQSVIVRWTNLLILVLFYRRKNSPFNVQLPSSKIDGVWIMRSVESEAKHFFSPTKDFELPVFQATRR